MTSLSMLGSIPPESNDSTAARPGAIPSSSPELAAVERTVNLAKMASLMVEREHMIHAASVWLAAASPDYESDGGAQIDLAREVVTKSLPVHHTFDEMVAMKGGPYFSIKNTGSPGLLTLHRELEWDNDRELADRFDEAEAKLILRASERSPSSDGDGEDHFDHVFLLISRRLAVEITLEMNAEYNDEDYDAGGQLQIHVAENSRAMQDLVRTRQAAYVRKGHIKMGGHRSNPQMPCSKAVLEPALRDIYEFDYCAASKALKKASAPGMRP